MRLPLSWLREYVALPDIPVSQVAAGARHITFMGGETFFRKDLGRILAHARDVGFTRVGVTTNGTVLSKKGFIGDLVKNNAKRMLATGALPPLPAGAASLERLNERVAEQLEHTLEALELRDDETAQEVWLSDVEIDRMQNAMFRELLTYMMEDSRNIGRCTHLLFCARNLERIGDHATNIAEQVHYIVTGKTMPIDRPKGDLSSSSER